MWEIKEIYSDYLVSILTKARIKQSSRRMRREEDVLAVVQGTGKAAWKALGV